MGFKKNVGACVLVCACCTVWAQEQAAPLSANQGQRNISVAKAQFDIKSYRIEGNSLLAENAIQTLLARFTGPQQYGASTAAGHTAGGDYLFEKRSYK